MKKILIITLGGTIAMKEDESGRANSALAGEALVSQVPELRDIAEFGVESFADVSSGALTFAILYRIARRLKDAFDADGADGAVVIQGTDTIEETAYFLDLVLGTGNPVVVIGSMRNISAPSYDGTINIIQACRVAADTEARDRGVMVLCNEMIHAARDVRKLHTSNIATFQSPFLGPIGVVDKHKTVFFRQPLMLETYESSYRDMDIEIVTASVDMRPHTLECCVERGADGIIVDGFGRGHVPPRIVPAIERAVAAGIPVVLTSQCLGGFVLDAYSHVASTSHLLRIGVILGGDLSARKARIKLTVLLGHTKDPQAIRTSFEKGWFS